MQLERAERLSKAWFKRFLKKGKKLKPPIHVSSKRSQKSEEGRLQITRPMLNLLYDLLLIVLSREGVRVFLLLMRVHCSKEVAEAQRIFWVPHGMTLPANKAFNYQNPQATEMTREPQLFLAQENDRRRDANRVKRTRRQISKMATVSGINVHVEDEREKLPEPGEGFVIVTDVNALSLDGILQNITDKSCQLWVKNRKVWTGVKSFEITKK